jgi:hypothetical protein
MSKFQVGDRVEFVEMYHDHPVGTQGTISYVASERDTEDDWLVSVSLDSGDECGVYDKRLKLEKTSEFRFRSDCGDYSIDRYQSFEDALAGFKEHSRGENEAEIVEIITHGKYKAVLKIEAV